MIISCFCFKPKRYTVYLKIFKVRKYTFLRGLHLCEELWFNPHEQSCNSDGEILAISWSIRISTKIFYLDGFLACRNSLPKLLGCHKYDLILCYKILPPPGGIKGWSQMSSDDLFMFPCTWTTQVYYRLKPRLQYNY